MNNTYVITRILRDSQRQTAGLAIAAMLFCLALLPSRAQAQCAPVPVYSHPFANFLQANHPQVVFALHPNGIDSILPCQAALLTGTLNLSGINLWNGNNQLDLFTGIEELRINDCRIGNLMPQLPPNLKRLYVRDNGVTDFGTLPASLELLDCSGNPLRNNYVIFPWANPLGNLPAGLKTLIADRVEVYSYDLDTLPAGLEHLSIAGYYDSYGINKFPNLIDRQLPALPASLKYLNCSINGLTQLPSLPSTLETLNCEDNLLTQLPTLPNSLCRLLCLKNDSLLCLPNVPTCPSFVGTISYACGAPCAPVFIGDTAMEEIYRYACPQVLDSLGNLLPCMAALVDSLTFSGWIDFADDGSSIMHFTSLRYLKINHSEIKPGVFTTLPATVKYLEMRQTGFDGAFLANVNNIETLDLKGTYVDSLPFLPSSLRYLDVSESQTLRYLTPSLPSGLVELNCHGNWRQNGFTAFPSTLKKILVSDMQSLTSLPALPNGLERLECYINLLTGLPALPASLKYLTCWDNQISCIPPLPDSLTYLDMHTNPATCIPNLPPNLFNPSAFTICNIPCGAGISNIIAGRAFEDMNGNDVQDTGELGIPYLNLTLTKGSVKSYLSTDMDGNYMFYVDSGNFNLKITSPYFFDLTYPSALEYNLHFPGVDSVKTDAHFGYTPQPNVTDVSVDLVAKSRARPGFSFCYELTYKNKGVLPASGTVQFTPDTLLGYTGQRQWNFTNLLRGQSVQVSICMTVPTSLTLGTYVQSNAVVTTTQTDVTSSNDVSVERTLVSGSFDPNDKQVSDLAPNPADIAAGKPLTYTVRFQNTGNDTAFFVQIVDTLDAAHLDIPTFEVISASHPYSYTLKGQGVVVFKFDNILLPDSIVNEPASHGFIRYSIKPLTTLQVGNQIKNTAHIFFDFNAPITTNTVVSEITQPSGLQEVGTNVGLSLVPNPTNGNLSIRADALAGQAVSLTVLDLTGRVVYSEQLTGFGGSHTLSLEQLSGGVYTVQLGNGSINVSQKLVLMK